MRSKKCPSPELPLKPSALVPLRSRFPKTNIKEIPGWRQPALTPNSMKVTPMKPYRVKSKRDFHSPLFYATDERLPLILQSRSSKLLPRLGKNKNLEAGSHRLVLEANIASPTMLEHNSKASVSMTIGEDPESDIESNPMHALFSHRSLEPPNNPDIKFLTEKQIQVKENKNVFRTQGVSVKEKRFDEFKDENGVKSKDPDQKKWKSEKMREKLKFLARGKRIKMAFEKRAKSVGVKNRRKKILIVRPESCEGLRIQDLSEDENPELEIKEFREMISNFSVETKTVQNHSKEGILSVVKPKIHNSNIPEVYPENPDSELEDQTHKNSYNKLQKKNEHNSESDSDNEKYNQSLRSGKNASNQIADPKRSSKKFKTLEKTQKSLDNDPETNHFIESSNRKSITGRDESDESGSFSPKITKRAVYPNTVTPVTIESSSAYQTPLVKSPNIANSRASPEQLKNNPKLHTRVLPGSRKTPMIESTSLKTYKKTKTSPEPKPTTKLNLKSNKSPHHTTSLRNLKPPINPKSSKPANSTKDTKKSKALTNSKSLKASKASEALIKSTKTLNESSGSQNLLQISQHSSDSENSSNPTYSKTSLKPATLSPVRDFRSKSKKPTQRTALSRDSPVSHEKRLEIRIIQAPDISRDSTFSQNTEFFRNTLKEDSDINSLSNFSSHNSFLKVQNKNKKTQHSRISSKERGKASKKPEKSGKTPRKSRKTEANTENAMRRSVKARSKEPKAGDSSDTNSDSYSDKSDGSNFSRYSMIRQAELDQKYIKRTETMGKKRKNEASLKYLKPFVSNQVQKQLKKLDPTNNFIINFSFSILKSINNLIKFQNLIRGKKSIKRTTNKKLARMETNVFDKDSLAKGKLQIHKDATDLKRTTIKNQKLNIPKTQQKLKPFSKMYYPREVTLAAMHSREASKEKPKPEPSKPARTSKPLQDSYSSSSSSSSVIPTAEERSKKSLLYEMSHQELILQIAKQIINTHSSEHEELSPDSDLDEESSSEPSIGELDLQDELNDLAHSLKTVPKQLAFGHDIRLSLLKQNQIVFDFKELESGNYEIDHENLVRFSKKQEFLGLQGLKPNGQGLTPYSLQVHDYDNLTEEQQYRYRIQKVKVLNKKREKLKERIKSSSPTFNLAQSRSKISFKTEMNSFGTNFEERVYLRLRGNNSPVFSPGRS